MKLKLQGKLTAIILTLLIILSLTNVLLAKKQIADVFNYELNNNLESDLNLGYSLLNEKYPGNWSIKNNTLYKADMVIGDGTEENGSYEFVDEVLENTGSVATIFMKNESVKLEEKEGYIEAPYVRVSTNVKNPDGKRAVGTKVSKMVADAVEQDGEYVGEANVAGTLYQTKYVPIKDNNGEILGIWFVGVPKAHVNGIINSMVMEYGISSLIIIIVAIVIIILFVRRLGKNIRSLLETIHEIENHNLTVESNVKSTDEIGEISNGLNNMLKSLRNLIGEFNQSSKSVSHTSGQLSEIANQTSRAVEEVARAMEDITGGTNDQARNMEESVVRIDELSDKIEQVNDFAFKIKDISEKTNEISSEGMGIVNILTEKSKATSESSEKVSTRLLELDKRSQSIGNIVETIGDFAEQTNLLALNAAIEAARAGEHGKGFAVVAEEVRKLAEQSSNAVNEIKNIVAGIQDESKAAVSQMKNTQVIVKENDMAVLETKDIFSKILKSIKDISESIDKIESYSKDMKVSKDSIVDITQNLSAISEETSAATEEVSASTEEQLASIEEVASLSESLAGISKDLENKIDKFKI